MSDIHVLALHGYHGSADVLRRQITPLASQLSPSIKFTHVSAPSLAVGDFGWWHEGFRGWERTRNWVFDLTKSQHFDGVFGFSQGAALTGLLAAVQETDSTIAPAFKFAIMVGGFTSNEPEHRPLFAKPISIPSMHIVGQTDGIVPMRDSLRLAARFHQPTVIEHHGGHVIPGDATIARQVDQFVLRWGAQVARETTTHGVIDG